jgi:hypothetical protein
MKNRRNVISICLLSMFCLSIISGVGATENGKGAQGQYAIGLNIDNGDFNTDSSWFRPYIVRNSEGGYYAWLVIGKAWFTKSSGKTPHRYWCVGVYTPQIHRLDLPVYKSPYISQVQLYMIAFKLPYLTHSSNTTVNDTKFTQKVII